MAINVGTLEAILRLRDELTPGVTASVKSLEKLGSKLTAVGGNIRQVGFGLTAAITIPLAVMAAGSVKAAVEFETAFAGVIKTVEDATDPFGNLTARGLELEEGFRSLALEIPTGANELARIGELAGQLGVRSEDILGFTRVIADLGVTTNLTIEDAATQLARFANIIDSDLGPQFRVLGNIVVALGNSMATTEAEIVSMALRLAASGKIAGLTEGEIFALSASLSSVGVQAQVGGTSVSKAIQKMTEAVRTGGESLDVFALVAQTTAEGFKQSFETDAAGAIESFVTGLGRMDEEGGNVFAVLEQLELGDQRLMRALLSLSSAGDLFSTSLEIQAKALREGNALAAEAARRYETTASQFVILKNQVAEVARTIGGAFLPLINAMIERAQTLIPIIQRWAERFAELSPRTQALAAGFVALVAAVGPVLLIVGQLAVMLGSLMPAIGAVKVAMSLFGNSIPVLTARLAFMSGGIKGLIALFNPWIAVIVAAVAALVLLWKHSDTFRSIVISLGRILKGTAVAGFALLTQIASEQWNTLKAFGSWILSTFVGSMLSGLVAMLQTVGRFFSSVGEIVANSLGEWARGIDTAGTEAAAFDNAMEGVSTKASVLAGQLGSIGLVKDVDTLSSALSNLTIAGETDEQALQEIVTRAIELREAGQTLTPKLAQLVRITEFHAAAAAEEAAALAASEAATLAASEAAAALTDDIESLRDELSGKALTGEVALLEAAIASLTPTQLANVDVMKRVKEALRDVRAEGGELSADNEALANSIDTINQTFDLTVPSVQGLESVLQASADAWLANQEGLVELDPSMKDYIEQANRAAFETQQLEREAFLASITIGERLRKSLKDAFENVPEMITAALLGGGNAVKAIGAMFGGIIGDSLGEKLTASVAGMTGKLGSVLASVMGPLGAMAGSFLGKGLAKAGGAIVGAFKGLFGRSTADNLRITAERMWDIALSGSAAKAAAKMAEQVGDDFGGLLLSLGAIVTDAGGVMAVGFNKVTTAARDTFSAIDMGKLTAEQALVGLTPVLTQLALEFENADAAGQAAFFELIQLAEEFGLDMAAITEAVGEDLVNQALGTDLPTVLAGLRGELESLTSDGLDPFLDRLEELGVLTDADRAAIDALGESSMVDFQAMQDAAERYGIELSALGPAFDEARLADAANRIREDFDLLTQSGTGVSTALIGMQDEIIALINEAADAGVAIPANMQPIIEQMQEMGLLVGENGEDLVDLSAIDFAAPIIDKFELVVDKLGELIDRFLEVIGATKDLGRAVEGIPTEIEVEVIYNVGELELAKPENIEIGVHGSGDVESFRGGGIVGGALGAPQIVRVHGGERVQTPAQQRAEAQGGADMGQRLASIERLLRDQPRQNAIAVADALALKR